MSETNAGPAAIRFAIHAQAQDADESRQAVMGDVARLTRQLHEALRELGFYPDVESALHVLPDARARLDYVSQLTGTAAGRVLASAEQAWEVQKHLESETTRVAGLINAAEDIDGIRHAFDAYADTVCESVSETNSHLFDMMLAQDFHDLSGQTIQRIVILARELEQKLSPLLPDGAAAPARSAGLPECLSGGPVHNPRGRSDVVAGQDQVDNLLDSLGL